MFEGLTKYIPDLDDKEKAEHRISKIEDAVYGFLHSHPECGLKYYRDILKSQGVNVETTPLSAVDIAGLSGLGIMALFTAAVQEERRRCDTLKGLYRDGSLLRWLTQLKKIDDSREK